MRQMYLVLAFVLLSSILCSQDVYQRVKVHYADGDELRHIILHAELDHFQNRKNRWIVAEMPLRHVQKLNRLGFVTEVQIPDMKAHIIAESQKPLLRDSRKDGCIDTPEVEIPKNYRQGSMAGFLTLDEALAELDSMQARYPHLISKKAAIDTFKTYEDRSIYFVKISDHPEKDEAENRVLYTALHHAREPGSLQQTIFYMWYLLENYTSSPEIKALLDTSELYFVPIVNPDGYAYNYETDPNGGGYWRKNRRDHKDGNYGVDNNRNYGGAWGTTGISTNTNSDVHCGPSAFSEPENQAIRWLCNEKNFKAAFNAHTHGSLMLYPYGHQKDAYTEDDMYYRLLSDEIVKYNKYKNQKATDLYPASGTSDDWMYDPTEVKPKIIAFTPEVGLSFYDSPTQTLTNNINMVHPNLTLLRMIHTYGVLRHNLPPNIESKSTYMDSIQVIRLGYEPGDIVVRIVTKSDKITATSAPVTLSNLKLGESAMVPYELTLSSNIANGEKINYDIILDNGIFDIIQPIEQAYGNTNILLHDEGNNLDLWTSNGRWGVVAAGYQGSAINDSPSGNYASNASTELVLREPYKLSADHPSFLTFWTKWSIEANYDYAQLSISEDNGATWKPLCGLHTKPGSPNQDDRQPIYDGVQEEWVQEYIELEDYMGKNVHFRFRLVSDDYQESEGFYFDEFKIYDFAKSSSQSDSSIRNIGVYPNPSSDLIYIDSEYAHVGYELFDASGRRVRSGRTQNHAISLNGLDAGTYMLKLTVDGAQTTHSIVKQ